MNKKVSRVLGVTEPLDQDINRRLELDSIKSQKIANHPISMTSEVTDINRVFCFKHQDKQIEYFCRNCHQLVCPKCMFKEHNGHEFAQLEEVTHVVKQNIGDL